MSKPIALIIVLISLYCPAYAISQYDFNKAVYVESMIYKVRTDRNPTLLKKIATVESAVINLWNDDLIKKQLEKDDTSYRSLFDSMGDIFNLGNNRKFTILNGALKTYDITSGAFRKNSSPQYLNLASSQWESAARTILERSYEVFLKRPNGKELFNRFLADEMGRIELSAEERLNEFPEFGHLVNTEELKNRVIDLQQNNEDTRQAVYEITREFRKFIKDQQSCGYECVKKEIEAFEAWGTLLSTVAELDDPRSGAMLNLFVRSAVKIAKIHSLNSNGEMYDAAALANYFQVVITVARTFMDEQSNGESFEKTVINEFFQIKEMLVDLTVEIRSGFKAMDERFDEVVGYLRLIERDLIVNREAMKLLSARIRSVEEAIVIGNSKISELLNTSAQREIIKATESAIGWKGRIKKSAFKETMSERKFIEIMNDLSGYARNFTVDSVATLVRHRSYDPPLISGELNAHSIGNNAVYIHKLLSNIDGLYGDRKLIEPVFWLLTVNTIIEFYSDWPEYQRTIEPSLFDELITMGNDIQIQLQDISSTSSLGRYRHLVDLIVQNLKSINDRRSEYIFEKIADVELSKLYDFSDLLSENNSEYKDLSIRDVADILFHNARYKGGLPVVLKGSYVDRQGTRGGPYDVTQCSVTGVWDQTGAATVIPNIIKIAHAFNIIDVLGEWTQITHFGDLDNGDPRVESVLRIFYVIKSSGGRRDIRHVSVSRLHDGSSGTSQFLNPAFNADLERDYLNVDEWCSKYAPSMLRDGQVLDSWTSDDEIRFYESVGGDVESRLVEYFARHTVGFEDGPGVDAIADVKGYEALLHGMIMISEFYAVDEIPEFLKLFADQPIGNLVSQETKVGSGLFKHQETVDRWKSSALGLITELSATSGMSYFRDLTIVIDDLTNARDKLQEGVSYMSPYFER